MRKWFNILFPFFIAATIQAQCSCNDCDVNLPEVGNASSSITLNGATSPIMGQNGQYLRAVNVNILHDAIDELDIVLITPDGNSISLSTFQGIQVGQNITFDICFVACNETPQPDPGYPAVFESDAGYQQDGFYNGSYYPAIGCLEDLAGNINGTWTLNITDNFIQDGGKLLDWSLEFANNDGLSCTESCLPPLCSASASQIGQLRDSFCRADPALDFNISPNFTGPDPDPTLFDYKFVIVDHESGVIIDYTFEPDLRNYMSGTYEIHGLAHEIIDAALIPPVDGNYTISDLNEDITNNLFCAKLSDDHYLITVNGSPEIPELALADMACAGDEVLYLIENYNPLNNYNYEVIDGNLLEEVEVTDSSFIVRWEDGPGEILIWASNNCDSLFAYEVIEIQQAPDISILGSQYVCPEDTLIYNLSDIQNEDLEYDFTVNGGEIIWTSNDSISVVWNDNLTAPSLCVSFSGIDCPPPTLCMNPTAEEDLQNINKLNSPDSICQYEQAISYVPLDSNVLSYQWSGDGIQILDGNGTQSVRYIVENNNTAEICLQVTSICGKTKTYCEEITVSPLPSSSIEEINNVCENSFLLHADIPDGNLSSWSQISGPSPAIIEAPNEETSEVTVEEYGVYIFELIEENDQCQSRDSVVVEINAPPEITNLNFDCSMQTYHVSFQIEGGTPPFAINGTNTSNRTFISNSYPSRSAFDIVVTDSNNCTDQINGLKACPCVSSAGSMSSDTLFVCAASAESAKASFDQNAVVDGNDTIVFILHTSEDTFLGKILGINSSGIFTYHKDLDYGNTYYISRVVGQSVDTGINLQDSCLSVAKGQPVIYYDNPETNINSALSSCDKTFSLQAGTLSSQMAVHWNQLSGPSSSFIQNPNKGNTQVTVQKSGIYIFECVSSNKACTVKENIEVEVFKAPEITSINKICKGKDELQLQIEVESAAPPLEISLPGKWVQNIFYTTNLTVDTIYEVEIQDENACKTSIQIDAINCDCPQLELPTELKLCDSENELNLNQHFGVSMHGSWSLSNPQNLEYPPSLDQSNLMITGATGGAYELTFSLDEVYGPECSRKFKMDLIIENQQLSGVQNGIPHFCQGNEKVIILDTILPGNQGNGIWIYGNDTISPRINIDQFTPGLQEFKYLMPTQSICENEASFIRIEVNPEPQVEVNKYDLKCEGDQYGKIEVIVQEPIFGPYSYFLNGEEQFSNIFEGLKAGEYKLLVRNRNGCSKELQPISILDPLPLELELGEDKVVERNEEFTIHAKTNISNSEIDEIIWEGSNGIIPGKDLHLSYSLASSNFIKATLIDINGCATTDKVYIAVDDGSEIYLPNVFYPQGNDPENRRFGIPETNDISRIKSFRIYDRWGNRVFEHFNFQAGDLTAYWNGTFDGYVAPMGVYIFTVTYVTNDGEEKTTKGNVTLLY